MTTATTISPMSISTLPYFGRFHRAFTTLLILMSLLAPAAMAFQAGGVNVIKSAACDGVKADKTEGTKPKPKPKRKSKSTDTTDKSTTGTDVAREGEVDCNAEGLGGVTNAAGNLIDPAIVAMAAVAPIACLFGAGALMFGSRRGLPLIGSALGGLVVMICAKGVVA